MYLKRIELYGFKSFADRTELEFVPGVTAVVGPNGSGKSNVSDSIRWVLGEQSAKSLRGAKMEDIIFAGSDSRKPVNYAEVGITLDNLDRSLDIDFSEVTVTRRVYRSGESEFFINKQSCRLKDITELFMDTGLGKEAYSIIGQGRIEEILSTKSEDRRGIFEEAAGVIKYKSRKREAERKLDETEGNLVRIQDIIFEIDEQLEPLKDQAEKARKYKILKKELTYKEISTYVYQIETLHSKWEEATLQLQELKKKEEQLSVEVNQHDAALEKTKWSVSLLEQKLEELQEKLLLVTEETEKLEGQREVIRERKRNFSTNKKDIIEKIQSLSIRKDQATSDLTQASTRLTDLEQQVKESKKALDQEENSLQYLVQNVDDRLDQLKGDYIDVLNENASMKNEMRHIEQSIQQLSSKISQLNEDHGRFVQERSELEKQIKSKEAELSSMNQGIEKLRQEYQQLIQKKKEEQINIEQHESKYRQYLNQLEKIKGRQVFLQEMKDDFAGFFQGVKEILKARESQLRDIDGAVAELIVVPKNYEVAIEIALGAALQHIVVQNEEAARQAIGFLKQRKLGRATFLPRSVMKGREISQYDLTTLKQSPGFVGMAHELISFEEKYHNVISSLLGNVAITTDLKTANELAKLVQFRYRFVTIDGDVVHAGGSMTGGSVKQNQSNLLGRERELEHLAGEISKANEAIAEQQLIIEKSKAQIREVEMLLEQVSEQGEMEKNKEQELKDKLSRLYFEKNRLDEKLMIYDQDMSSYQSELKRSEQRKLEVQTKLSVEQQKIVQIEVEIKELEKVKKEKQANREEKSEQITQLKVKHARLLQEYEGQVEHVERVSQHKSEIESELYDLQRHLLRLEGDLGQQEDQVDELELSIQKAKKEKEQLTEEIEALRQQKKNETHELERLEIVLKQLRKDWRLVEERSHQEEVKVNRYDVELDNYLSLLREEYELSFELAKERYPLEAEYSVVKQEVDTLKRQLQALGTVNLGAIEEYERLEERYTFLKRQEEDLNQAKATLYQVIAEMDQEMSQRFKETFDQVRTQFLDVFQQLFGGGRADLILADPDNLLTTGVDIVAQPPGKKLQHLALLSGGERALTAMALLFAILRVKPVPFCVLDEVEAALDEANVARYAQYLREFSKQTQFIVITHRKGTMEGADVLYGVTMQESGVSRLVSVKLEEKEEKMITA